MIWLWAVVAVAVVGLIAARRLRFRAWVKSQKDPKARMEAEILWSSYRRNRRWWQ